MFREREKEEEMASGVGVSVTLYASYPPIVQMSGFTKM